MNIWEKMLNIDRRWIFLIIGVVCIVPFLLNIGLPVFPTMEVETIYDYVDLLGPEDAIFIAFDFDPGTAAENMPMAVAGLRHAFARGIPVFMTAVTPLGQGMIRAGIGYVTDPSQEYFFQSVSWEEWAPIRDQGITDKAEIAEAWEAAGNVLPDNALGWVFEGRDYAMLGYAPLFHLVILGMGNSIARQYPQDANGNPLPDMPMLTEHKSLREIDLVITSSGSAACRYWITYGREKIGLPVAFAVTAVMASDYFIFIQSGQIIGQMGGLRGAAEYEVLLEENGVYPTTDKAFQGMDVQSVAHIAIFLFVLLGNIAFFAGGYHKKSQRLKGGR